MDLLICEGGEWSVAGGAVSCSGTAIVSVPVEQVLTDQGFITQEAFEAFWPWALGMFAVAFGFKLMRRLIWSRG